MKLVLFLIVAVTCVLAQRPPANPPHSVPILPPGNCRVNVTAFANCPFKRREVVDCLFANFGEVINGTEVLDGHKQDLAWKYLLTDAMKAAVHNDPNAMLGSCDANQDKFVTREEFQVTGCKCLEDCHKATLAHIACHIAEQDPNWRDKIIQAELGAQRT